MISNRSSHYKISCETATSFTSRVASLRLALRTFVASRVFPMRHDTCDHAGGSDADGACKWTLHLISGAATIRNRPRLRHVCSPTDQLCGEHAILSTDANAEVTPCSRCIQGMSIYIGHIKKDEPAVGSGRNSAIVRTTTDLGGAHQRILQLYAAPG